MSVKKRRVVGGDANGRGLHIDCTIRCHGTAVYLTPDIQIERLLVCADNTNNQGTIGLPLPLENLLQSYSEKSPGALGGSTNYANG